MSLRETLRDTTAADRVLFLLLIGCSLLALVYMEELLPRHSDVRVEVEGRLAFRYLLDRDRVIQVTGPQGHLTVEVRNKKVRVVDASCPNKLCEHQGWVQNGTIICIPGRIAVIVGGPADPGDRPVDAITG